MTTHPFRLLLIVPALLAGTMLVIGCSRPRVIDKQALDAKQKMKELKG